MHQRCLLVSLYRTIEHDRPPKTTQIDFLLLESQETLASFFFNSMWFKLSFYSNRATFSCVSHLKSEKVTALM